MLAREWVTFTYLNSVALLVLLPIFQNVSFYLVLCILISPFFCFADVVLHTKLIYRKGTVLSKFTIIPYLDLLMYLQQSLSVFNDNTHYTMIGTCL
jgi:hypothetical protein